MMNAVIFEGQPIRPLDVLTGFSIRRSDCHRGEIFWLLVRYSWDGISRLSLLLEVSRFGTGPRSEVHSLFSLVLYSLVRLSMYIPYLHRYLISIMSRPRFHAFRTLVSTLFLYSRNTVIRNSGLGSLRLIVYREPGRPPLGGNLNDVFFAWLLASASGLVLECWG